MAQFAYETCIFYGTLKYCAKECLSWQKKGYDIEDANVIGRAWPRFWLKLYEVKLRKPMLIELKIIADCNPAIQSIEEIKKELKIGRSL